MKALRLDLFQETACYRKPFAIKISETYPLPPYSTINGLLHRILDAKEYIPMRISIQGDYESLVNEYQTTYFYKKNTVTKMPMNQHLLLNVKLIVHINAEDSVLDKLYDRIKNLDEFLSLGRREDLLRIDDVQFVELNEYEVGSDVEDDEDDDRYDWDLEDDNRKMVILGIVLALVIVAVIGVGAYFFLNRDKGNTEQPAQTTEEQEDGNAELVIKGDGDSADGSSEAENQQTEETDSSEEETPEEEQPAEEEPAEPETVTMKVNASSVNVRSEASTDSSIVTKVANGETVEVVGDASQEWVQIRCTEQDGKEGYVKSEFLTAAE